MTRIEFPDAFQRNSQKVLHLGVETTGASLIACGNRLLAWPDLGERDILDIGCGTRFTQTLINRQLPVGSYTGIEIDAPLVDHLTQHVRDRRFSYHYWHVYNEKYNRTGQRLTPDTPLPIPSGRSFDLIWMYSVITHTAPYETRCLLTILRRVVRDEGALVFSAFIDPAVETSVDRQPDQPLAQVWYNGEYLRRMITETGWTLDVFFDERLDPVMQNLFVCRPACVRPPSDS